MFASCGLAPQRASDSSTRPVRSGVLGSIIALWSANGTRQRNSASLSRSNAPQPPSRFCIARIHLRARWQAEVTPRVEALFGRSRRAGRALLDEPAGAPD